MGEAEFVTTLKESLPTIEESIHPPMPHLVIEPRGYWSSFNLRDLWRYRELFYFLTWRDVKVRYKQTVLGAAWAILQPVFNMILFSLIFGRVAKLPSDNIPYPLFAFAGLLPWTFFSNAIGMAGNSLVGNSHLVTKVYFPRMIIPAAAVLAGLVDFAFAFAVMGVLLVWYQVPLSPNLILAPALALLISVLAFATGTLLSSLNVKYRDIRYVIPFLIQFWFFATPIIYPMSMMPGKYRWVYRLNPLTGIIEAFRVSLLGGVNHSGFDWASVGSSALITLLLLTYAAYHFRGTERIFADII
jgi:lipopolysaccharide transport system permease protein